MYYYTNIQIADAYMKNVIFEQMEEHVKNAMNVEDAVASMEYAFYYYPGHYGYQIAGSQCEFFVEALRRSSVCRMTATLNERFPELSKGRSPATWMEAYGNKSGLDGLRESDCYKWYKEWYDQPL